MSALIRKKKLPFKWIWSERYKIQEDRMEGKRPICRMPIEDKLVVDEFKKLKQRIELAMSAAEMTGKKQKVVFGNSEYVVLPSTEDYFRKEWRARAREKKQFNKWTPNNWNV